MMNAQVHSGAAYAASLGPPPVLVVDDDATDTAATLAALAGAGYPTTAECDGDAVLRLVRSEVMRLVVSEIYIPCSEGACLVTALKQERDRLPHLRVLVLTRHTAASDDAWALAAGCSGVLHKPAAAAALLREVRRLEGRDAVEPTYEGKAR